MSHGYTAHHLYVGLVYDHGLRVGLLRHDRSHHLHACLRHEHGLRGLLMLLLLNDRCSHHRSLKYLSGLRRHYVLQLAYNKILLSHMYLHREFRNNSVFMDSVVGYIQHIQTRKKPKWTCFGKQFVFYLLF